MRPAAGLALFLLAASGSAGVVTAADLPAPLVRLRAIDPTIRQDMRYAGPNNFTGARLPGYSAAECILARPAAIALRRVQRDLAARGLSLKVYDCYRPQSAIRAMMRWVAGAFGRTGPRLKRAYYPRVARQRVVAEGYVAPRSSHATGYSVDLTLVRLSSKSKLQKGVRRSCRRADGSLDMGTGYDCLDPLSHTNSRRVSARVRRNRQILVAAMRRHGFLNYWREWWHFGFAAAPRGARDWNVPIR